MEASEKMRKLGDNIAKLSFLGIICATAWWWHYYRQMIDQMVGTHGRLPLKCLYSTSGECWVINGLGNLAGVTAYDPILFWVSCGGFIAGLILKSSAGQG